MTIDEMVAMVEIMSNEHDEDKIKAMLQIAGGKIIQKAYPFDQDVEEVPVRYHLLQCEIASYLATRGDALGEIQHNENGVDITWASSSVPDDMLADVTPFAKAWGISE